MQDSGRKVVVVEDDVEMNQAIVRLLKAASFYPVTYPSAEVLLEDGAEPGAGCMVFDVNLPGIGGFELRERLAARGVIPPVIFITAFDAPAVRTRAEKVGAVAYLRKPFEARSLIEAVRDACDASAPDAGEGT